VCFSLDPLLGSQGFALSCFMDQMDNAHNTFLRGGAEVMIARDRVEDMLEKDLARGSVRQEVRRFDTSPLMYQMVRNLGTCWSSQLHTSHKLTT
jgi:hypothetical protein